jgi:hypothetical protein
MDHAIVHASAIYCCGRFSIPGQVTWSLWWTKGQWGRFSLSTAVSLDSSYSTDISTLIAICLLELVKYTSQWLVYKLDSGLNTHKKLKIKKIDCRAASAAVQMCLAAWRWHRHTDGPSISKEMSDEHFPLRVTLIPHNLTRNIKINILCSYVLECNIMCM